MFRYQLVLNLSPSISAKATTVSENPSRGATKASGPLLLSIRTDEPGGGSTPVALRIATVGRSRTNCISGCATSQSRMTGCSIVFGLA